MKRNDIEVTGPQQLHSSRRPCQTTASCSRGRRTFADVRDAGPEIVSLEIIGGERHAILHATGPGVAAVDDFELPDGIYNVFTLDQGKVVRIDDRRSRPPDWRSILER